MVFRFLVAGLAGGLLFGILDGLANGNPLAQKLMECYRPIARDRMNMPAGLAIDLAYGFALAGIFVALYPALPGGTGLAKGLSLGGLAWFLRVVMQAASHWIMFRIPVKTLLYVLFTGLIQLCAVGILFGLVLAV